MPLVYATPHGPGHREPTGATLLTVILAAPHIFFQILDDPHTWRALRSVSRDFRAAVDPRMYSHLRVKTVRMGPCEPLLVTITRPFGWVLPGFLPRSYTPPPPSTPLTRLSPSFTVPSLSSLTSLFLPSQPTPKAPPAPPRPPDPFWAPLLVHARVVDMDLCHLSRKSLATLRPYLTPHTLRVRFSFFGEARQLPVAYRWFAPAPLSCASRLVIFPNTGRRGFEAQANFDIAGFAPSPADPSASRPTLFKLVANAMISRNGVCFFPDFDPLSPAVSATVLIFTLIPDQGNWRRRPGRHAQWAPLLRALAGPTQEEREAGRPGQSRGAPSPSVTLVGLPDGEEAREWETSVALVREVLRRCGADLARFRFLSREEYVAEVGRREFEIESVWLD